MGVSTPSIRLADGLVDYFRGLDIWGSSAATGAIPTSSVSPGLVRAIDLSV